MSGMHLLPVYYTTTNHKSKRKKPRKISKRMEASLREHEKFLKKMGVSSEPVAREPAPRRRRDGPCGRGHGAQRRPWIDGHI